MFPARYFAPRYFAPRYWPKVGATSTPLVIRGRIVVAEMYRTETTETYRTATSERYQTVVEEIAG